MKGVSTHPFCLCSPKSSKEKAVKAPFSSVTAILLLGTTLHAGQGASPKPCLGAAHCWDNTPGGFSPATAPNTRLPTVPAPAPHLQHSSGVLVPPLLPLGHCFAPWAAQLRAPPTGDAAAAVLEGRQSPHISLWHRLPPRCSEGRANTTLPAGERRPRRVLRLSRNLHLAEVAFYLRLWRLLDLDWKVCEFSPQRWWLTQHHRAVNPGELLSTGLCVNRRAAPPARALTSGHTQLSRSAAAPGLERSFKLGMRCLYISPLFLLQEQQRLSLYSLATKEPAPLLAYAACTTAPESACDTANRNITGEPGRPRHHGGISEWDRGRGKKKEKDRRLEMKASLVSVSPWWCGKSLNTSPDLHSRVNRTS